MQKLHQFGIKLVDLMLSNNNFFVVKVSLKKKTASMNKLGEYFPYHSRQPIANDKVLVLNWVRIYFFSIQYIKLYV